MVRAGAILGPHEIVEEKLSNIMRHTGPALSPFNAWLLAKGLETLNLRVERHSRNAHQIEALLANDPQIANVLYPGLATHPQHKLAKKQMRDGGKERAFRLLNALEVADISNNLGDAKTLITHPATTTHQRLKEEERAQLGISDGMV